MRLFRPLSAALMVVAAAIALTACGSSNTADSTGGSTHTANTRSAATTSRPAASTSAATAASSATKPSPATTGTTSSAKTAAKATPAKKSQTSETATATTTSASGGSGLSSSSGPPECGADDFTAKQLSTQGASGKEVLVYALVNTASSSCYTFGWPGVAFYQADGQATTTNPVRVTSDDAGAAGKPRKLILDPGNEASFRLIISESSSGGGGACVAAASIAITPPNGYASLKLGLNPRVPTCGIATVTPMLAGTSANP